MRRNINEVKDKQDMPQSYDIIDDVYIVDQNIEEGVQSNEQSPSLRMIGRKLVFSEYVVENPTPNFNELYKSNQSELSELDITQQNNLENIDLQLLFDKSENSQNTTEKKKFSKKVGQDQIPIHKLNLPTQKSQKHYEQQNSNKQIQLISMKQPIKIQYQSEDQVQQQNNVNQTDSLENQQNLNEQVNSPTKQPLVEKINEQKIQEKEREQNVNEICKQQIEDSIQKNLNQLYDNLCSKIQNTKVEMYNKNKLLKDICKHEQTKYISLYQRSSQMTQLVHVIYQNN